MTTRTRSSASTNGASPPADTPGRPTQSGSRQQTHADQAVQSGSPQLDSKRRSGRPDKAERKSR